MSDRYVVYLDVFFLINFLMDYIVLRLTSFVMQKKHRRVRIAASAGIGALYSIIILKPLLNHFKALTIINLAMAFVLIFIAFGYENRVSYIKNVLFFMTVSFFLGGIMNYLYYTTNIGRVAYNVLHGTSNRVVNARKFIVVTFLAYYITLCIIKLIIAHKKDMKLIFEVKLSYRGRSVVAKGLLDTGNGLVEPISGKMVHVAEQTVIKPILEGDETAKENFCVIPFQSVGKKNGILYGIRIDEMVVLIDGEPYFLYSPVIAIYEGTLSNKGKYSMILNRDTFEDM